MQAYLDNSATTRCSEGVRDIVVKVMMEDFGNPSSRQRFILLLAEPSQTTGH